MTLCWPGGRGRCPHKHDEFLITGRTRSGKRWFWCVSNGDDAGIGEHGYADTDTEAEAAYTAAAERIAGERLCCCYSRAGYASRELKRLNAAKRAAKPASDADDARIVEYLYGTYHHVSDDNRFPDRYGIAEFPITKKTAKRVYYLRNDDGATGFVDRQVLEREGEIKNRGRAYYDDDWHLYATREAAQAVLDSWTAPKTEPVDLQALRRAAVEAHPDRGGSNEAFREAHARYQRARQRAKAAATA
jgi:hypothetical protein